jgi:hypothetical protein
MFITADCRDPLLGDAVNDVDEWRDAPVRHRYVNGHFKGTGVRFSLYLPAPDKFEGRFFQNTHQLLTSENAAPSTILFAIASGGYLVQSIPGPSEAIRSTADALSGRDASVGGYRVNAAAAKYSKTVATEMYGQRRIYGFLYGGSGGAYQVIAALQNTAGVWDGGLPFVMGTPDAIPSLFTVRIHALRVLKGKFPQIMDAIEPGGGGDMYAGLDEEQRGALREATLMGFPPRGWFDYPTLNGGPLALVAGYVPALDPTYVEDFWTKPGYLGTDPKSSVGAARIRQETTITAVNPGPPFRLELEDVPTGDLSGADLAILSGVAAGKTVPLGSALGGMPPSAIKAVPLSPNSVGLGFGADPRVVASIKAGDKVRIDNSWYLALQTYHRHQVPTPDLYGWNQFRGPNGTPLYPQRKVLIGPIGALNAAGSIANGQFQGKMMVMQALMDIDAFPWQAGWYRTKVREAGRANDFRLYYVDRSDHIGFASGARSTELANYEGALQQMLRDLTAWVERGVAPPAETRYHVADTQIVVPARAAQRLGIQPTVELKANGSARAEIHSGEPVALTASIELPPGTGKIIAAEWDFDGQGAFVEKTDSALLGKAAVTLNVTHVFDKPGTYFPSLRVTSHRDGEFDASFARVQNLARVRVVVS